MQNPLDRRQESDKAAQLAHRHSDGDQVVSHYLFQALYSNEYRLWFRVIGALVVKAKEIQLPNGVILLPHPTPDDMDGRSIEDLELIRAMKQAETAEFLFDGYIDIAGSGDPPQLAQQVKEAVQKIRKTVALLGVHSRSRCRWNPAKWITFGDGTSKLYMMQVPSPTSAIVDRPQIVDLFRVIRDLAAILAISEEAEEAVFRSIDWCHQGLNSMSSLNGFLCYWFAIENLLNFWDTNLGATPPNSKLLDDLLKKIEGEYDYVSVDRVNKTVSVGLPALIAFVNRAHDDLWDSTRRKAARVLSKLLSQEEATGLDQVLFAKESDGFSSWSLRSAIAHGTISEGPTRQMKAMVEKRTLPIRKCAVRLIDASIDHLLGRPTS